MINPLGHLVENLSVMGLGCLGIFAIGAVALYVLRAGRRPPDE